MQLSCCELENLSLAADAQVEIRALVNGKRGIESTSMARLRLSRLK